MLPAFTLALLAAVVSQPSAEKLAAPAPGARVPDFNLKDIHRRPSLT